jgi:predicted transcriptional regulator
MSTATLSFRASAEFAEQTKALADVFNMSSSDYVREAVREKNERMLQQRMVYLSKQLAALSLAENESMNSTIGDGLV